MIFSFLAMLLLRVLSSCRPEIRERVFALRSISEALPFSLQMLRQWERVGFVGE
jgi:hypothetical protein